MAKQLKDKVKLIILNGIPVLDLKEDEKELYSIILNELKVPTFLIQNENDFHGNIAQVREVLSNFKYTEILKKGETHQYNYPEEILKIIKENTGR